MEPITIAALLAMLASAGVQYKASTDASKRAEEQTRLSLARQAEFQRQAEKAAMDRANEFKDEPRAERQTEIQQQLEQEFVKPAETAQAINQNAATTQGNVSNDYTAAKATSDANTLKSARTLANLLSKATSSGRLRLNEGFGIADTAGEIGRYGSFSQGQSAADAIAIRNAAQPDAGMVLGGQILGALGAAGLMSGVGAAAKGAAGGASAMGTGGPMSIATQPASWYGASTGIGSMGAGGILSGAPKLIKW